MDALDYVEMLATVDRQISGLEDLLKSREMPPETAKLVQGAALRWQKIRLVIARQNEPHTVSAPQADAVSRAISVMEGVAASRAGPLNEQARDLVRIARQLREAFGEAINAS